MLEIKYAISNIIAVKEIKMLELKTLFRLVNTALQYTSIASAF